MRLLVPLLLAAIVAGCSTPSTQHEPTLVALAAARQYVDGTSLLELGLALREAEGDVAGPALAAVEDVRATLQLRSGETVTLTPRLSVEPGTAAASGALEAPGRFDAITLDATFVLADGTRRSWDDLESEAVVFQPWEASISVEPPAEPGRDVVVSLGLYEFEPGARGQVYAPNDQGLSTYRPVVPEVRDVEAWTIEATFADGTRTEFDTTPQRSGERLVAPLDGVAALPERVELRFRVTLESGHEVTHLDVRSASWPSWPGAG